MIDRNRAAEGRLCPANAGSLRSRSDDSCNANSVGIPSQLHQVPCTAAKLLRSECMPKKPTKTSTGQLSLFDAGLNAPATTRVVGRHRTPKQEILSPEPVYDSGLSTRISAQFRTPHSTEPSPFEKASYELYLKLKSEVNASARTTGVLAMILVAVVFLRVPIPEIGVGLFRVDSLSRDVLVGLVGWLTLLSALNTLIRAAYMIRKKLDCGLFYQRILQFSGNSIIRFVSRFFDFLFVATFLAIIALTTIVAWVEMIKLVDFIIREFLFLFNPWRPTINPT
jgi:hypothetical protein